MITTSAIYWTSFLFAEHMQHIAMAISCMYVKVYVAYLDHEFVMMKHHLFSFPNEVDGKKLICRAMKSFNRINE